MLMKPDDSVLCVLEMELIEHGVSRPANCAFAAGQDGENHCVWKLINPLCLISHSGAHSCATGSADNWRR
jgi:hypothetical protein